MTGPVLLRKAIEASELSQRAFAERILCARSYRRVQEMLAGTTAMSFSLQDRLRRYLELPEGRRRVLNRATDF